MKIDNAVALVTGANRGIGLAFTRALLARGARKVYAGARDPSTVTLSGVEPVRLDVTKPDEVAAVAARARDVTLVINNAGVGQLGGFLAPDSEESARRHLETNFFGMLRMSHAFAPVLAANGGGALLNVLSIVLVDQRRAARRVRGEQIGGLVADERAASRARRATDAGAGAAHGLRRHRPRARAQRPEGQPRRDRRPRARRARGRARRSARRRTHPTRQARPDGRRGRATCRSSPDRPSRSNTGATDDGCHPDRRSRRRRAAAAPRIAMARVLGRERRDLPRSRWTPRCCTRSSVRCERDFPAPPPPTCRGCSTRTRWSTRRC